MNHYQYEAILKTNGHLKHRDEVGSFDEPVTVGGFYKADSYWFKVTWNSGQCHVEEYGRSPEVIDAEQEWAELFNSKSSGMNSIVIDHLRILWSPEADEEAEKLVKAGKLPDFYDYVITKVGLKAATPA